MAEDISASLPGHIGAGSRIAGYLIEQQVGVGGMAVVFRGRDEVLGRPVAVKVLSPALAANTEFRTRFLRESRWIAAVDEPHILPVYSAGDANGVLYIATRFVAGGDLATLLRHGSGPLAPERVVSLIEQVSAALDAAHAIGLVHRDVKPGNILIEGIPGRPEHAYLADFGLTKPSSGATGLTATGIFMGTPDYCAPEQILGGPLDGRTDQYALGCVTFNLLTGTVPYQRTPTLAALFAHVKDPIPAPTALRRDLPPAVDTVLAKAMAKEPAGRYASCGEFAAALRGALLAPPQFAPGQPVIPAQVAQPPISPAIGTPTPVAWAPSTATVPHPGIAVLPANPGYPGTGMPPASPGYLGTATPLGSAVPPAAVPYAPGPYAGYTPPTFPGGIGPGGPIGAGGKLKRKTAVIAGVSGAVVLAGCVALVIALLPGPGRKPPVHHPTAVLTGATEVATFTPPDGGTFDDYDTFFSPDGKFIVAQGGTGHQTDVYILSAATHKYVTTIKVPKGDQIYPLSITPDDRYMIAAECTTSACNIYEYAISSGQHGSGVSVPLAAYAVNDDGTTEANETLNAQFIDVWNLQTGKFTGHFPNPTTSPIVNYSLWVSGDGSEMLLSAVNGKAYVMSARTGQTLATIPYYAPSDPQNPKNQPLPELSPDGKTVYIPGSGSTPPQVWSVATGTNVTPKSSLWPKTDNWLAYSTDGTVAVTSPANAPFVDVWNVDLGSHVTRATIPGSNDWAIDDVGPSGNEVLFGLNPNKNHDSAKLFLYSVP